MRRRRIRRRTCRRRRRGRRTRQRRRGRRGTCDAGWDGWTLSGAANLLTVRLRDAESAFGLCLKGQGGAGRGFAVRAGGFAHQGSSATTWSTYEGASLPGASGGGGGAGVSSELPRLSLSNSLSNTAAYSATAAPSSRRTMLLNHRKPLRNDLNPIAPGVFAHESHESPFTPRSCPAFWWREEARSAEYLRLIFSRRAPFYLTGLSP